MFQVVFRFTIALTFPVSLVCAQLIPSGSPVPRTSKPPVVFLNGHQNFCGTESFSSTFGNADRVLQANGEVSIFFDNCDVPGKPPIEGLADAFGTFLSKLQYTDGQPVTTVDVVAHSMGGLIVRSYLSGKQTTSGVFNPPLAQPIRKAVFLASPNFGTPIATFLGIDTQVQEMASGSRFIFDLATWNQGSDDLRGIDAVAGVGNGGSGLAVAPGFDDGVIALTSGSIGFYMPGRTRVLPYCHVDGGGLTSLAGFCSSNAKGIADITSAADPSAQIITSFFNGTRDWQNVGTAADKDPFLSTGGGLVAELRTANDGADQVKSADVKPAAGAGKNLNVSSNGIAYTDLTAAGPATVDASDSIAVSESVNIPAGTDAAITLKPGPQISRVSPAAARVFPLSVAPGTFVAIYGSSLAAATAQAQSAVYPTTLSDAQVQVNGSSIPLYYVSGSQIDAVMPSNLSGLVKLTVQNGSGSRTVNVMIEPAVPAIFTQDESGSGTASAENAVNGVVVSQSAPLHAGDYLALYLTGLGATTNRGGLDWANQQPTVSIAGQNCPVTYAGRAPGYQGLDQINCVVPSGVSNNAAQVVVTSGARTSNVATIAVQ